MFDFSKIFKNKHKYNMKKTTTPRKKTTIKTSTTSENHGVVLFKDEDLQNILKKSGKLVYGNEFQVHYWSLNLRHISENDGSILDISIPTVFFNYKQQVSSASIDFELKDVISVSEKTKIIHNIKVNEIIKSGLKERIEEILGIELFYKSENFNSLHKHPGNASRQAFSSTDLSKDLDDLGIVFPLAEAKNDKANFAGIMAIENKKIKIAHYEYRTVNGDIEEDIKYNEGRCIALVARKEKTISNIEKILGCKTKIEDYAVGKKAAKTDIFYEILKVFKQLNYTTSTDAIISDNIEEKYKEHTSKNYYYNKYYGNDDKDLLSTLYDVSEKEYKQAVEIKKKYDGLKIIPESVIKKSSNQELKKIYDMYYSTYFQKKNTEDWSEELKNPVMFRKDIEFEISALLIDMEFELDEAISAIKEYESKNNKNSKNDKKKNTDDSLIHAMEEELICLGYSKSKIISSSPQEIIDMYDKATNNGMTLESINVWNS